MGYQFFPEIILRNTIKYPLIVVFSIFLPVSFLLKLKESRTRYHTLLFAMIFTINIGLLTVGLARNYSILTSFIKNGEQSIPQNLAEFLTTEKNEENRRIIAQIFYQQYGVSVPYKLKENAYTLYVPDQEDKKHYRANAALAAEKEMAKTNLSLQTIELFFLLILHAGLFFLVIVLLPIFEQKKTVTMQ